MTVSVDEMCGRIYNKYGMTITYVDEYNSWAKNCKFNCSIHGEFSAVPKTLFEGKKNCPSCKNKLTSVNSSFRSEKLTYGKGVMDLDMNLFDDFSRYRKIKNLWIDMLERCYSNREAFKSYRDCEVSESWYKCSNFFADIRDMENYQMLFDGWHLDKDFVSKSCRLYSKDTCCILPKEINMFIASSRAIRGKYPIGVTFDKSRGKFTASASRNGKHVSLGRYNSTVEAFEKYKSYKENELKVIADKYKSVLCSKSYNAVYNYKVEITD